MCFPIQVLQSKRKVFVALTLFCILFYDSFKYWNIVKPWVNTKYLLGVASPNYFSFRKIVFILRFNFQIVFYHWLALVTDRQTSIHLLLPSEEGRH